MKVIHQSAFFLILFSFGFLFFGSTSLAETPALYHPNPVVGTVDGEAVTFEELRNKKIHDLSVQLYQQLNNRLLEYAVEKLAKKYKEIKLNSDRKVTEAEIVDIYENNDLKNRGTLDELRPQIKKYMEEQIQMSHIFEQYALAQKKGWLVSHLSAPSEFVMKGYAKTAYIRGNKNAKVMVLEFSDYQCPFCSRVQTTIDQLISKYKDRVAFGYRHLPLAFHKEADEAAIAAECAREQGKFEIMHRLLFSRQKNQTNIDLKRYAREILIADAKKYDQCLDSDKYRGLVNQDMKDGAALGLTGTPGFFGGKYNPKTGQINGEILSGAQPYSTFKRVIEKYLL